MIPKILHFVWVGDESKLPREQINSWVDFNPTYTVKLWTDRELNSQRWALEKHIREIYDIELCGVADMMRYEIVYSYGGIALDADSTCQRPLDDHLLEPSEFFCWESEKERPGLIATAVMAGDRYSEFFGELVNRLYRKDSVVKERAWITTGPTHLTDTYKAIPNNITVYPSHYFIPNHFKSERYKGTGAVYCTQDWGSTV